MTKRNSKPNISTVQRFAMTPLAAAVVAAMNPGSVALAQDIDEYSGIEEEGFGVHGQCLRCGQMTESSPLRFYRPAGIPRPAGSR